ncbi:hypothetical protein ACIQVA_30635 [Streptomyces microflavus]|uniref:hypothetical protein n=1 Tax=Streptomyces microflavus TaxID=1919 RepID=UPI0037FCDFC9
MRFRTPGPAGPRASGPSTDPQRQRGERGEQPRRCWTTAWLNWCDLGGLDPYTCARAAIGVWISDQHEDDPVTTRAAIASAVTSFYQHLLDHGIADGVDAELTRARLIGAPVPADPKRTGLRGDGPRWMMQAADRLTGRDALRDRALIYLLLNGHFGHEKLRPGTIRTLNLEDRVNEGIRTTWKVRPKNAEKTATTSVTISRTPPARSTPTPGSPSPEPSSPTRRPAASPMPPTAPSPPGAHC